MNENMQRCLFCVRVRPAGKMTEVILCDMEKGKIKAAGFLCRECVKYSAKYYKTVMDETLKAEEENNAT